MKKIGLTGKHILLLLLYSPTKLDEVNESIRGRTRLMKMMFLFEKEIMNDFISKSKVEVISFPDFYSWNYGPFAVDIYNDIEFFSNNGFIQNEYLDHEMENLEIDEYDNWIEDYMFNGEHQYSAVQKNEECFKLTEKAMKYVSENIYIYLTEKQKTIIKKFKTKLIKSSLKNIINYTYLRYPDYTDKSKIREKVFA